MLNQKKNNHATTKHNVLGSFAVIGAALFIFGVYLPFFFADGYADYIAIRDSPNAVLQAVSAIGVLLLIVTYILGTYLFLQKNFLVNFIFPTALFVIYTLNALIQSDPIIFYEGAVVSAIIFSASIITLKTSGIFGLRPVGATVGWVLIFVLVGFLIMHGLPENRWVGGVHPNLFGATALAALILHSSATGRVSRKIALMVIFATVIVSSRGSLAATLVFLASYIFFFGKLRILKKSIANTALASVLVFIGCLVLVLNAVAVQEFIMETTAINDPSRGLDSGLTGRAEYWPIVIDLIMERPFWGDAQAADGILIHSGLLDAALRFGFLPIALFILAAALMFIRKLVNNGPQVKIASLGGLVLLSYSVLEESLFAVFNIQAFALYACISIAAGCAASHSGLSSHFR